MYLRERYDFEEPPVPVDLPVGEMPYGLRRQLADYDFVQDQMKREGLPFADKGPIYSLSRTDPYIGKYVDAFSTVNENGEVIYTLPEVPKREELKTIWDIGRIATQEQSYHGMHRITSSEQRAYVWVAGRGICTYCVAPADPELPTNHPSKYEVDHLVPHSNNGRTLVANLAVACRACNQCKGSLSEDLFRDQIEKIGIEGRNEWYKSIVEARQLG